MTDDSTDGATGADGAHQWRKSSFSAGGECVALAEVGEWVAMRNSNAPGAGILLFTRPEFGEWLANVKAGRLDELVKSPDDLI